jgi:hypothetical protein
MIVSKVVTLRLSDPTADRLKACARRAGRSISEMGAVALEEWLRQQEFADIEFRAFGGERHACLKGSLPIWQIVMVARAYEMNVERTAAHFEWPAYRAQAAFTYYKADPDEIDEALAENRAVDLEKLRRMLPRLETFTVPPAANATPG